MQWQDYHCHLDSPYVYIVDEFGVRLHKIVQRGDSLDLQYLDRVNEYTNVRGYPIFKFIGNHVIMCTDSRFYTFERQDEQLEISGVSEFNDVEPPYYSYGFSEDSLFFAHANLYSARNINHIIRVAQLPRVADGGIIVEDKAFVIRINEPEEEDIYLLRYDISDIYNPVLLDSFEVNELANTFSCHAPIYLQNYLVYFYRDRSTDTFCVLFVHLDNESGFGNSYEWTYEPTYDDYMHPPRIAGILNDSLIAWTQDYAFSGGISSRMYLFDPGSRGDPFLGSVDLPGDWWFPNRNEPDYRYDSPGSIEKGCLLLNYWSYSETRLLNFSDPFNPRIVFSGDIVPENHISSFRAMPNIPRGNAIGYSSPNRIALDLRTGGDPDTLIVWGSSVSGNITYVDSIYLYYDNNEEDYAVFDYNGTEFELMYTLRLQEEIGSIRNIQLKKQNDTYLILYENYEYDILHIMDLRAVYARRLVQYPYDAGRNFGLDFLWTDVGLFVLSQPYIVWYELSEGELLPVDSVEYHSEYFGQFIYESPWLGAGRQLFEIRDRQLILVEEYSEEVRVVPEGYWISAIDNNGRIAFSGDPGVLVYEFSPMLGTLVASLRDVNAEIVLDADTIWAFHHSFHHMSKYVFTEWNDVADGKPATIKPDGIDVSTYPTPFNNTLNINYSIPYSGDVQIQLYNLLGKEVKLFYNGYRKKGKYHIASSMNDLPSGIYFVSIQSEQEVYTKKVLLLK
ncbi:T9SS type A sorting domain-containing protein [bacterium]|nr:T9SS type A sorting domain-containing protein [bacterium]